MWFCRESNSEQLLILNFMLKTRSYLSGNRRNFGKMSGIFAPFNNEFLSFSKIWPYLTLNNAISCHLRQKIEKMARGSGSKKFVKVIGIEKTKRIKSKLKNKFQFQNDTFFDFSEVGLNFSYQNTISCHIRQKIEKMAR